MDAFKLISITTTVWAGDPCPEIIFRANLPSNLGYITSARASLVVFNNGKDAKPRPGEHSCIPVSRIVCDGGPVLIFENHISSLTYIKDAGDMLCSYLNSSDGNFKTTVRLHRSALSAEVTSFALQFELKVIAQEKEETFQLSVDRGTDPSVNHANVIHCAKSNVIQ